MGNVFEAGINFAKRVISGGRSKNVYKSVTKTPTETTKIKTVVTPNKTTTKTKIIPTKTSTPAATGGSLTAKTSGIGKFAVGAGTGALGLSLFENFLGGETPEPIPEPEPERKYILDPYTGIISPFDGEEGGTAYLSGDPYGESGSETVLDETVETLKEYAPYLIGFGVIVVIVALVTGNRKGKGKKGGNRK